MIKNNVSKLVIASISLVVLSGCANNSPIISSQLNIDSNINGNSSSYLYNNMRVEAKEFRQTRKFSLGGNTTLIPTLNNDEAERAIVTAIDTLGFYNSNGDYIITAELIEDNAGMRTNSRTNKIRYSITNINDNSITFDKVISGEGSFRGSLISFPHKERHRSGSLAFEDNFKKLIEELRSFSKSKKLI